MERSEGFGSKKIIILIKFYKGHVQTSTTHDSALWIILLRTPQIVSVLEKTIRRTTNCTGTLNIKFKDSLRSQKYIFNMIYGLLYNITIQVLYFHQV